MIDCAQHKHFEEANHTDFKRKCFLSELISTEMHALDHQEELTPVGRILAKMPIEPRLGKMIILGCVLL